MSPRAIGLALLGLAALVYFVVGAPARVAERAANDELARLRSELTDERHRLEVFEKGAEVIRRAGFIEVEGGGQRRSEAVRAVRAGVIQALQQANVGQVRLEVKPGEEPALAGVSLSARGSFFALVHLAALLSKPGSGLVVQRVTMGGAGNLAISFEAVALGRSL